MFSVAVVARDYTIGRPRRVRVGEWACPVQFAGLGETLSHCGAWSRFPARLLSRRLRVSTTLWRRAGRGSAGAPSRRDGLPTSRSLQLRAQVHGRVNQHIDRELERFVQSTRRRLKGRRPSPAPLGRSNKPSWRATGHQRRPLGAEALAAKAEEWSPSTPQKTTRSISTYPACAKSSGSVRCHSRNLRLRLWC